MSKYDLNDELLYKEKYVKYKNKYLELKKQEGGRPYSNKDSSYILNNNISIIFYNKNDLYELEFIKLCICYVNNTGEINFKSSKYNNSNYISKKFTLDVNDINGLPNIYIFTPYKKTIYPLFTFDIRIYEMLNNTFSKINLTRYTPIPFYNTSVTRTFNWYDRSYRIHTKNTKQSYDTSKYNDIKTLVTLYNKINIFSAVHDISSVNCVEIKKNFELSVNKSEIQNDDYKCVIKELLGLTDPTDKTTSMLNDETLHSNIKQFYKIINYTGINEAKVTPTMFANAFPMFYNNVEAPKRSDILKNILDDFNNIVKLDIEPPKFNHILRNKENEENNTKIKDVNSYIIVEKLKQIPKMFDIEFFVKYSHLSLENYYNLLQDKKNQFTCKNIFIFNSTLYKIINIFDKIIEDYTNITKEIDYVSINNKIKNYLDNINNVDKQPINDITKIFDINAYDINKLKEVIAAQLENLINEKDPKKYNETYLDIIKKAQEYLFNENINKQINSVKSYELTQISIYPTVSQELINPSTITEYNTFKTKYEAFRNIIIHDLQYDYKDVFDILIFTKKNINSSNEQFYYEYTGTKHTNINNLKNILQIIKNNSIYSGDNFNLITYKDTLLYKNGNNYKDGFIYFNILIQNIDWDNKTCNLELISTATLVLENQINVNINTTTNTISKVNDIVSIELYNKSKKSYDIPEIIKNANKITSSTSTSTVPTGTPTTGTASSIQVSNVLIDANINEPMKYVATTSNPQQYNIQILPYSVPLTPYTKPKNIMDTYATETIKSELHKLVYLHALIYNIKTEENYRKILGLDNNTPIDITHLHIDNF